MTGGQGEELTALQMAQNAALHVLRYADLQVADPVQAHITGAGKQGMNSAVVAGNMALVSIAESLHRIVELVDGAEMLVVAALDVDQEAP